MTDTKERILQAALQLFSRAGYEAVSVRDIAGALGITQGALYRHYPGKRAIFEEILHRMEENDRQRAAEFRLPERSFSESPEAYRNCTLDALKNFTLAMFRYWTEDAFAAAFRRMLAIEQYHAPELNARYQQYLGDGVVRFLSDIFREHGAPEPEETALRFYAPFYLLLNQYDVAENKTSPLRQLEKHLKGFSSCAI